MHLPLYFAQLCNHMFRALHHITSHHISLSLSLSRSLSLSLSLSEFSNSHSWPPSASAHQNMQNHNVGPAYNRKIGATIPDSLYVRTCLAISRKRVSAALGLEGSKQREESLWTPIVGGGVRGYLRTRCPKAICGHRYPCPAVCLKLL